MSEKHANGPNAEQQHYSSKNLKVLLIDIKNGLHALFYYHKFENTLLSAGLSTSLSTQLKN